MAREGGGGRGSRGGSPRGGGAMVQAMRQGGFSPRSGNYYRHGSGGGNRRYRKNWRRNWYGNNYNNYYGGGGWGGGDYGWYYPPVVAYDYTYPYGIENDQDLSDIKSNIEDLKTRVYMESGREDRNLMWGALIFVFIIIVIFLLYRR